MFKSCKYIVVADADGISEKMIMFDGSLMHETVAKAMARARYPKVVSAGFVDAYMNCFGESMSVGKRSRDDIDSLMIRAMLDLD